MFLAAGADIEEFIIEDGEVSSAIGKIGGDKANPVWVTHGNLQEDNVLAEYAINPCTSEDAFVRTVLGLRGELKNHLAGFDIGTYATYVFERDKLISFGKKALEFGCSAEYDCWSSDLWAFAKNNIFTRGYNNPDVEDKYRIPTPSAYTEMRTAGGHVHFSYENPNDVDTLRILRTMDYLLGCWSVIHDPDKNRRAMYGKAGACRIKSYGGEYRVLSNFWVQSEEMIRTVYKLTKAAVDSKDMLLGLTGRVAVASDVQQAINTYDKSMAEDIFKKSVATLGVRL